MAECEDCPRWQLRDRLHEQAEGYALAYARPADGPMEITLSREMGAISGTVADPAGVPLAGVDVVVRSLVEPGRAYGSAAYFGDWDGAPAALTDDQGRFSIGALPMGRQISLSAERAGLANYHDTYSADWPVTGDEVRIVMSPEARISGRVTCDGEPVADVDVGAQANHEVDRSRGGGGGGHATTGADGRYEIHGVSAGTFNVALTPPEGYTAVAHEALQVAAGESAENIDFELIEGVMLRGVVTWADTGEPVPEAAVAAYGPAHPKSSAWCQATKMDADGRYELRLPPGRNYIYWQGSPSEARHAEPENLWVEIEEGVDQTLDFRLFRKPIITLTVFNPDGTSAAGVPVHWDAASRYGGDPGDVDRVTDADGQIELTYGRRAHRLEQKPMAAALVQDVDRDLAGLAIVNGETDREATITLQQGAWIETSVEDREGNPLPDILVYTRVDDQGWSMQTPMTTSTDADGCARIGPLPADVPLTFRLDYQLANNTLSEPDEARDAVRLSPGETRTLEPFVIAPEGFSVSGMVVDADGNPVEGALVFAGRTEDLQTTTDAEGHFELAGLSVRADTTVLVALPDGSAAYAEPIDPEVPLALVIELAEPVTIVATVLDADGQPVGGATAAAHSKVAGTGLPAPLRTRVENLKTDENGQFTVENLVAGLQYGVMAYTGDRGDPEHAWGEPILIIGGEGVIEMTLPKVR